jgi:hypothetical protein
MTMSAAFLPNYTIWKELVRFISTSDFQQKSIIIPIVLVEACASYQNDIK